jgi:hypothetical protein
MIEPIQPQWAANNLPQYTPVAVIAASVTKSRRFMCNFLLTSLLQRRRMVFPACRIFQIEYNGDSHEWRFLKRYRPLFSTLAEDFGPDLPKSPERRFSQYVSASWHSCPFVQVPSPMGLWYVVKVLKEPPFGTATCFGLARSHLCLNLGTFAAVQFIWASAHLSGRRPAGPLICSSSTTRRSKASMPLGGASVKLDV